MSWLPRCLPRAFMALKLGWWSSRCDRIIERRPGALFLQGTVCYWFLRLSVSTCAVLAFLALFLSRSSMPRSSPLSKAPTSGYRPTSRGTEDYVLRTDAEMGDMPHSWCTQPSPLTFSHHIGTATNTLSPDHTERWQRLVRRNPFAPPLNAHTSGTKTTGECFRKSSHVAGWSLPLV